MSAFDAVAQQFARPVGPAGRLAGWIMAARPSNRARNDWTLELLEIRPQHQVLEIGFGPGYAISRLAPLLTSGQLVGIDHSEVMLEQATRRNAGSVAEGRVRLILGGIEAIRSLEPGFDRVYSANMLQFVADRTKVLRDIRAILAPGGLVATTYQPRHPRATDADALRFGEALLADMAEAGFAEGRLERGPRAGILSVCAIGRRD